MITTLDPKNTSELNSLGFAKAPADTRVVVAMSGGVDSSVVAGLLARQGFEVIGITLQLYDHGAAIQKKGACCAGQDIHDARRVAAALDIPHYVLDYENIFSDAVIDEFADAYLAGETPIPCIRCNERVKFKDMLEMAKDLGADCMATGHYVQHVSGVAGSNSGAQLHRGVDPIRDQSYFLFTTTREQLDFLRFPLGGLGKDETRALAQEFGLAVASKPDSQDICFVPEGKYADVIMKLRPEAGEPGNIVHIDGAVLGRHTGILNFTIGQRKGLGVATGDPLYVVRIDAQTRDVLVGPREALFSRRIHLKDVNWLGDDPLSEIGAGGLAIGAKVRSTRPPMAARLFASQDGHMEVVLDDGDEGISPGQACVFYDPDGGEMRVLGGGWIDKVEKT
jgi:tRNA-specific 2-thiouridylase